MYLFDFNNKLIGKTQIKVNICPSVEKNWSRIRKVEVYLGGPAETSHLKIPLVELLML